MKNTKEIKSSKKVGNFLEKTGLHKKDFAQMIGVTLSYVYNIIDESIPFSSRSVTIERIATVMDILPEDFKEYIIEEDPIPYNSNLETIKDYIKKNNMTTVDFLKQFERKKRLKMVDILRGATPLPIDLYELKTIKNLLHIEDDEFFNLWKDIFKDYLQKSGVNLDLNRKIFDKMLTCVKDEVLQI